MHKRYGLAAYRLFLSLLTFTAIIVQLVVALKNPAFKPTNFFSFFTIESNILAATIFLISGSALLLGKQLRKRTLLRGAAVLYMSITGIVYALLLSGLDAHLGTTLPWVNTVLHYIMPVAVLADWLFDVPDQRISFKAALIWLAFPLLYVAYSLIRGPIVHWYPYPFLNPAKHGYAGVAVVCAGILVAGLLLVWIISGATRLKARRQN